MKAIIEKKTVLVKVNSKFTDLVSTTYFLGINVTSGDFITKLIADQESSSEIIRCQ